MLCVRLRVRPEDEDQIEMDEIIEICGDRMELMVDHRDETVLAFGKCGEQTIAHVYRPETEEKKAYRVEIPVGLPSVEMAENILAAVVLKHGGWTELAAQDLAGHFVKSMDCDLKEATISHEIEEGE